MLNPIVIFGKKAMTGHELLILGILLFPGMALSILVLGTFAAGG